MSGRTTLLRLVMPWRTRVPALGLVPVLAVAVAACATSAAGGPPTSPATASPATAAGATSRDVRAGRPFPVHVEQRTFVDTTRPTKAGKATPAAGERTLRTTIYVPEAPGPRPTILFSHGLAGHPDKFSKLLGSWAAAGYVVVAPAFPLTNNTVPGNAANASDLWNQPADVRFVLDEVLDAAGRPGDTLEGRVDAARLGAGGLSLGGATTYGLVFNECCREPRIIAAEVLSGGLIPMSAPYVFDRSVPLLIMHGDHDLSLPYSGARDAFAHAMAPAYLVTLEGGTHAPPFEDDPTPYDGMVEATTLAFWDAYLGGATDRRVDVEREASVPGLARLERKVG